MASPPRSPSLSKRAWPLLVLLALAFWSRVLVTGQVLLPGEALRGFAPFGSDPKAFWPILQWDALGQYYPWRHFAGEQLRQGHIPLWNPYQFAGTPFLANGQSALFYPLNLPFWVMDTAFAFSVSALLGSLVALAGTYALARRWKMSRAAAVVSAVAFAFCGYLSAWALLPTLFQTACWLPACLLFFERAVEDERPTRSTLLLAACLSCALLAGHAQIFFYIVLALALRQPFLKRTWRGLALGVGTLAFAGALGALQLLPMLELAAHSPRVAASAPTEAAWQAVQLRALGASELPSLLVPGWSFAWGSVNENFGYVGLGVSFLLLASLGALKAPVARRQRFFALVLAAFGLLYALATPVAQLFFFAVPGVSSMGGTGRALVLWSLGAALCAGFGLDFLRARIKLSLLAPLALLLVGAELTSFAVLTQPTAPRTTIYPRTQVTDFLAKRSSPTARVWFFTDKRSWLPVEGFRGQRTHPLGALPPNGATVYGIYDIGGYDSLSSRAYRGYVGSSEENQDPSPALNGNMILLQTPSPTLLDSLSVRWIVFPQGLPAPPNTTLALSAEGCDVYERALSANGPRVSGAAFYQPGLAPETFRFGVFVSLCALGLWSALWFGSRTTPQRRHAIVARRSDEESSSSGSSVTNERTEKDSSSQAPSE